MFGIQVIWLTWISLLMLEMGLVNVEALLCYSGYLNMIKYSTSLLFRILLWLFNGLILIKYSFSHKGFCYQLQKPCIRQSLENKLRKHMVHFDYFTLTYPLCNCLSYVNIFYEYSVGSEAIIYIPLVLYLAWFLHDVFGMWTVVWTSFLYIQLCRLTLEHYSSAYLLL